VSLPLASSRAWAWAKASDFYWPSARLVVETDGYAFHNDRPAFERDHESTIALIAAGYKVLRATYRMLKRNPDPFLRLVADTLRS